MFAALIPICVPPKRKNAAETAQINKIKNYIDMREKIASLLFRMSAAIERLAIRLDDPAEYQPVLDDSEIYS